MKGKLVEGVNGIYEGIINIKHTLNCLTIILDSKNNVIITRYSDKRRPTEWSDPRPRATHSETKEKTTGPRLRKTY